MVLSDSNGQNPLLQNRRSFTGWKGCCSLPVVIILFIIDFNFYFFHYFYMKGYICILECSDGSYYTGSTKDLVKRIEEHNCGNGANYTKKKLPVKLVYYETYHRIDDAFSAKSKFKNGVIHRKKL